MHWLNWTSSLVWGCFLQCRSSSAVFLRIRSVRILDSIVCSRPLVWLFSPAWDAVKLACQKAVFIFPGHWRATTVVLQDECLTPFYLSPTQNILPFYPIGIKASCVALPLSSIQHTRTAEKMQRACSLLPLLPPPDYGVLMWAKWKLFRTWFW